jgi:hypothetical protein
VLTRVARRQNDAQDTAKGPAGDIALKFITNMFHFTLEWTTTTKHAKKTQSRELSCICSVVTAPLSEDSEFLAPTLSIQAHLNARVVSAESKIVARARRFRLSLQEVVHATGDSAHRCK